MNLHRNSQKRIYIPDAAYFITVKTLNNEPFFREPILCDLFVEELRVRKIIKNFELYGWFLGYDHSHLLIRPMGIWNYSEIMFSIKKQFSHNANRVMSFNPLFHIFELKADKRLSAFNSNTNSNMSVSGGGADIGEPRLRPGFRKFAPEICRLELGVIRARIRFILKYDDRNPFPVFRWQESFRDHYCRDEIDFQNHLESIAYNPTKHNLPMDWPYVFTNPKFEDLMD